MANEIIDHQEAIPKETTPSIQPESTPQDKANNPNEKVQNNCNQNSPLSASKFESLKDSLPTKVPRKKENTVPDNPLPAQVKKEISEYNYQMANVSNDATVAAIWSFVKNEEERTERQKPLLNNLVKLTIFQLVAFNVIIAGVAWLSFKCSETTIVLQYFEILKYYIGATVAELLAMIWFVTKGTFSSEHIKMLSQLLDPKDPSDSKAT